MISGQKLDSAQLLFGCARAMGLQPDWITPGKVFVIITAHGERYINITCSPLNPHTSVSLAKDKHLTRLILQRHNLLNIPFLKPKDYTEAVHFLHIHKTIIAKPTNGSGSRNIQRITTEEYLRSIPLDSCILEQYISGKEMRYLVLNGTVIGVYRSDYGTSVAVNRPMQCISLPKPLWDLELIKTAAQIASILGLKFAAVDYLLDDSGQQYILEVNTSPDIKWFHAPSLGPTVNVARLFLESVLDQTNKRSRPISEQALHINTPLASAID